MIVHTIQAIEQELRGFYELEPGLSALDVLMTRDELSTALADSAATINERGGVYFVSHGDEVFIGLHIGPTIEAALAASDPAAQLTNRNLDAFCVIVEELSHFHLLLDRMRRQIPVTKVELEWQGEVDKLLFSAILLRRQSGSAHYHHLARCLFEQSELTTADSVYREASDLAARFWYDLITYKDGISDPAHSQVLKSLLKTTYSSPWEDKLAAIRGLSRKAA